jgi:leucyl-tRNA synthetase
MILGEDNEKMSKSRGNVIPADHVLERYGADAVRLYEMFLGPLEQVKPWNTNGIEGISRFLSKVWRLIYPEHEGPIASLTMEAMPDELLRRMHKTIKKVGEDTENLKFNTAIAEMMVFVNELQKAGCKNRDAVETLLLLLAPYAPHISEELWEAIGHSVSISSERFPSYDPALVEDAVLTIAVQINGKLRGTFIAPAKSPKELLLAEAKKVESVLKFLEGQTIVREIVIPDKLVSFAVK